MSHESDPPARVPPTAAWLAEQEAKQRAYEAKRRAWTQRLHRGAEPEVEEVPEPTSATSTAPATAASSRRPRGRVHDPRQQRFEF